MEQVQWLQWLHDTRNGYFNTFLQGRPKTIGYEKLKDAGKNLDLLGKSIAFHYYHRHGFFWMYFKNTNQGLQNMSQ